MLIVPTTLGGFQWNYIDTLEFRRIVHINSVKIVWDDFKSSLQIVTVATGRGAAGQTLNICESRSIIFG